MRVDAPLAALAALALTSCGPSDNDPGPGGVTVGEARALDEAAEMLEERRTAAEVLAEDAAPPETGATESGMQGEDEDDPQ